MLIASVVHLQRQTDTRRGFDGGDANSKPDSFLCNWLSLTLQACLFLSIALCLSSSTSTCTSSSSSFAHLIDDEEKEKSRQSNERRFNYPILIFRLRANLRSLQPAAKCRE